MFLLLSINSIGQQAGPVVFVVSLWACVGSAVVANAVGEAPLSDVLIHTQVTVSGCLCWIIAKIEIPSCFFLFLPLSHPAYPLLCCLPVASPRPLRVSNRNPFNIQLTPSPIKVRRTTEFMRQRQGAKTDTDSVLLFNSPAKNGYSTFNQPKAAVLGFSPVSPG